jgi:hypothetical protein
MSRVKDMIIEREETIIALIRRVAEIADKVDEDTANEIWDAWYEHGLPYDDEDMDILFDIVTDDEVYEYTVNTATKFLEGFAN